MQAIERREREKNTSRELRVRYYLRHKMPSCLVIILYFFSLSYLISVCTHNSSRHTHTHTIHKAQDGNIRFRFHSTRFHAMKTNHFNYYILLVSLSLSLFLSMTFSPSDYHMVCVCHTMFMI